MKKLDTYSIIFLCLFGIYVIFSFSTMGNYGMTWDEAAQQHVGKVSSDYVRGRSDKLEFLREDLVYYGPFFEMINQDFGTSMLESFRMDYIGAFHVLIILAAALGMYFFFRLVALFFGTRTALFSSAFLMLWPIFAAHSQYNTKDIPLFSGLVITFFFLSFGFKERKFRPVALAGLFFGLTLATRIDSLFLLLVFFPAYALYAIFGLKTEDKKEWLSHLKKDFLYFAGFLSTAAFAAYAAWPTLWKNPFFFFKALGYFLRHGWPGQVLYFGKTFTGSALPWHFVPFYFLVSVSAVILALAFLGMFRSFRSLRRGENIFGYSLILLWLFFRLAIGIFPGSVKYDGIRHFIAIVPALMVFSAFGLDFLLEKIPKYFPKTGSIKIKAGILGAVFFWLLIEFFWVFPFGGSYLNEPARTLIRAPIEKKFDFEYWGASYKQGIDWLNIHADPNSTFCVPIAEHLLQFYPTRADLGFNCSSGTKYLMFITRWGYLPADLDGNFHYSDKTPAFTVSRYGSNLLEIYKLE